MIVIPLIGLVGALSSIILVISWRKTFLIENTGKLELFTQVQTGEVEPIGREWADTHLYEVIRTRK